MKSKKTISIVILLGLIGVGVFWYLNKTNKKVVFYRTAPVERGDLLATINATGTVEPEELVDVGAQVAGLILSFGKDKDGNVIDYGSFVAEGTVLAKIDDSTYASDVALAKAQLEQAKAGVENAKANLLQLKAKLVDAQADWERAQKLGPSEALAQSTYDSYRATYEAAVANVAVGEASILQAQAAVGQAEAVLKKANLNLAYCTIESPVNGVIIDRRVNIGQTVISSLNTPSLFLIAKDLRKMQVWVAVNEADIGKIYPGQPVTFTVSTYEGQTFKGVVGKIRLNATMTQNVVTYTVEVDTDNSNGKLLPYLTANVNFEVNRKDNVLEIPNAAFRWKPRAEEVAPEYRSALNEFAKKGKGSGEKQYDPNVSQTQTSNYRKATLWVSENGSLRPIKVLAGISDDTMTEVQGNELKEDLLVITGEQQVSAGSGTVNPFTPQILRGRPAGR
jgi:HlyD family secretion protein